MSGIQEILVVLLILLAVLYLPRIGNRAAGEPIRRREARWNLSGRMRLALVASFLWPALMILYLKPGPETALPFAYLGLGPVVLGWAVYWVVLGYRRKGR